MRETILDLLSGKKIDAQPVFSGLIHVTADGLEREGLALHETHHDADKMARAAMSTFKLTGMRPSVALPLDACYRAGRCLTVSLSPYPSPTRGEGRFVRR